MDGVNMKGYLILRFAWYTWYQTKKSKIIAVCKYIVLYVGKNVIYIICSVAVFCNRYLGHIYVSCKIDYTSFVYVRLEFYALKI